MYHRHYYWIPHCKYLHNVRYLNVTGFSLLRMICTHFTLFVIVILIMLHRQIRKLAEKCKFICYLPKFYIYWKGTEACYSCYKSLFILIFIRSVTTIRAFVGLLKMTSFAWLPKGVQWLVDVHPENWWAWFDHNFLTLI